MGHEESSQLAVFSWADLVTTDCDSAKTFYQSVLGWSTIDSPKPADTYVLLRKKGVDVAGLFEMSDAQQREGTPPHWLPFVSVENVDRATLRADKLGASAVNRPTNVGDAGRMSVIEDIGGAVFALWEAQQHPGTGLFDVPGSLSHFEYVATDIDQAIEFYTDLFNWKADRTPETDSVSAILHHNTQKKAEVVSCHDKDSVSRWRVFFTVAEIDQANALIEENGGAVIGTHHRRHHGRVALAKDPQGAVFGILKGGVQESVVPRSSRDA